MIDDDIIYIYIDFFFLQAKLDCQQWKDLQANYKSVKKLFQDIRKEMESIGLPRHR